MTGVVPVSNTLFRAKTLARRALVRFPYLYAQVSRLRHPYDGSLLSTAVAIGPDTEVLITGLPRSGNSFATNAFRLAQEGPVRVAHHEYPPPQIAQAARYGIPALLIVRGPDEVSLSRVISHPPLTLKLALEDFSVCHRAVLRYRPAFVLATFEEVTSDFGAVIRRLNGRFGTDFREFEHNPENVQRAFEFIDDRYKAMGPEAEKVFDRTVARPSQERTEAKNRLRAELASPGLAAVREEAWSVYQLLTRPIST